MAEVDLGFDLFGDPVILDRGGPGRPEHKWSRENSNKVLLAFARGLSVKEAGSVIGVSAPTLRKVYFSEVAKRQQAALRMEMTQLARLNTLAEGGNVSAEKELLKQLGRLRLHDKARALAPEPTPRAANRGKKEEQKERAAGVGGKFAPPEAPSLLN